MRDVVTRVPPLEYLPWRFALATVCLLPWLFGQRPRLMLPGLAVGVANALGFLLQSYALQTTGADQVAFLTGLAVVLVPVAEALLRRRWPSARLFAALGLGLVGLALLTVSRRFTWSLGDLLGLLSSVLFALQYLGTSRLAARVGGMRLAAQELLAGTLVFVLAALLGNPSWLVPPPSTLWPVIAFLALVATVATLLLQNAGQARVTATAAALTFNLEPVFASLWAFVLAGESLTLREGLGAVCVLASMLVGALAPGERAAPAVAQGALLAPPPTDGG